MCEVWAQDTFFEAVCIVANPKTGSSFKVPFFPVYYFDSIGTRKPLGIPSDRSIEIEGPLIFVGFGMTKADDGWDDYEDKRVEGKIAVMFNDVPRKDYERFPKEPYASSNYKVSNAARHGAKAVVLICDPFREPGSEPTPVTYGEEILGIFIPTSFFNLFLSELQRGFDLSTLRKQIEEKLGSKGPFPLDLSMKISYKGNEFKIEESEHFIYLFHPGSLSEKELETIVEKREEAYARISQKLGVEHRGKVRFFLFPSAREKTFYTGTVGGGWAEAQTIIEIYDSEIKLDPWHELTHILSRSINQNPASLLSEGLAVYMVAYMSGKERQIDEKALQFNNGGELIPIMDLFDLEIGSGKSKPVVSYPESGSFIKYLVEHYGMGKFKQLYSKVDKSQNIDEKNRKLCETYSKSINELEREWLNAINTIT